MLSYEICKKLEEAGFPQTSSNILHYCTVSNSPEVVCDCGPSWEHSHPTYLAVPTLSELIKECGDQFRDLEKLESNWSARVQGIEGKRLVLQEFGTTPEEAVANLYLQIKQS